MDEKEQKRLAEEQELERKLEEFDKKATPSYLRKRYKLALAKRIDAGEIGLIEEIKKLDVLESTPEAAPEARPAGGASSQPASSSSPGEAGASSDPGEDPDPEKRALLAKFAVRPRSYNMSEAALAQRRTAANSPAKAEAMKGNANAWKTGEHARSRIRQLFRPCTSTCPQYPCELIDDGETAPGSVCLDKKSFVRSIMALQKAIVNKDLTDLREIASVQIAHGVEVLHLLADDILTNGVKHLSEKIDKDGNVIGNELRGNPSLLAYAKLMEVLNMTPNDFLVTPREIKRQKTEQKKARTLGDIMSGIGLTPKDGDSGDEDGDD